MNKLDHDEKSKQMISNYKEQEKMMILIYAQWCLNNDIDPIELYEKAYPDQFKNEALQEALSLTVPREESEEIAHETVIHALQLFGNDDLAFLVQQEIEKKSK